MPEVVIECQHPDPQRRRRERGSGERWRVCEMATDVIAIVRMP